MSEKKTIKQTLNDAADYIEKYGLNTLGGFGGGFGGGGRPVCALGAIREATPNYFDHDYEGPDCFSLEASRALANYLGLEDTYKIPRWNDRLGHTKEEVIAALRGAAEAQP